MGKDRKITELSGGKTICYCVKGILGQNIALTGEWRLTFQRNAAQLHAKKLLLFLFFFSVKWVLGGAYFKGRDLTYSIHSFNNY